MAVALALIVGACGGREQSNTSSAAPTTQPAAQQTAPPSGGTAATSPQTGASPVAGAPQLRYQGAIRMYAQAYTPGSQNTDVKNLKAFREVADEYQRLHPGITIEFVDEKYQDYDQTVRLQAAGKELPDVYWAQWSGLNGRYPKGIAADLKPALDQPNPYIPGDKPWRESLNQTVVAETAAPGGSIYQVNGDYVATAFFYNQDLFQKAGISKPPATWRELLDVCQRLKAAGINPVSNIPNYSWWQRHWLSDFYSNDYERISGFDKQPGISGTDEAVAINKGLLSTKDPRFMAWWPVFKQFTDQWKQDLLTTPLEQSDDTALRDFIGGKSAIYYSGSWTPNQLRSANAPFKLSSFNFPKLDKSVSEYATGAYTANAVGGPTAGYQYAMATESSNATMGDPAKQEAVLDWMRFIGTPKNVEKVSNELGQYLPTPPGTKPSPALGPLAAQADQPLRAIQVGPSGEKLPDQLQRQFSLFLHGDIDLERATGEVQEALDRASEGYAKENNLNFADYR
jgi:raffinose/stachyose/melibiose transport system substrate-binding protein